MIKDVVLNGMELDIDSKLKTEVIEIEVSLVNNDIESMGDDIQIKLDVTMQEDHEIFSYSGYENINTALLNKVNKGGVLKFTDAYSHGETLIIIDYNSGYIFCGTINDEGYDDSSAGALSYNCHDKLEELKQDINFLYQYVKHIVNKK